MFLTSANLSSKPEIYDSKEIEKEFEYYLEK
jgi:tRNA A37 threonylcarbamoyladenosine synthetase subunit TsaC/SUA5/YrdC